MVVNIVSHITQPMSLRVVSCVISSTKYHLGGNQPGSPDWLNKLAKYLHQCPLGNKETKWTTVFGYFIHPTFATDHIRLETG